MRKVLLVLLLGAGLCAQASDALRLFGQDGSVSEFVFDEQPELSFAGSKLKIASASKTVCFELDDISHISFAVTSGLADTPSPGISFAATAQGVEFTNLPQGAEVEVIDLQGRRVLKAEANGSYLLRRADIGQGTHIVKIQNFVTKIAF